MGMPQISVKYFAALRELRGFEHEVLDVAEGSTVRGLLKVVWPGVSESGDGISFACNHRMVPPDTVLKEGDLVVFLPPFGGG